MSIYIRTIWGLYVLAADIVYVIVLPQLTSALFLPWTNVYGAITAFLTGAVMRLGAGESTLSLVPIIKYPGYDEVTGMQLYPFRAIAFVASMVSMVLVSWLVNRCFGNKYLQFTPWDTIQTAGEDTQTNVTALGDLKHCASASSYTRPRATISKLNKQNIDISE